MSVNRSEDNDASRIEAATTAMSVISALVHDRALSLGNDGKEIRGLDRLVPSGRKKIREDVPFAIRFHLAPGVEAVPTADGLGALIRSPGAPPWNFRCRGAQLGLEESVIVDGSGHAPLHSPAGAGRRGFPPRRRDRLAIPPLQLGSS